MNSAAMHLYSLISQIAPSVEGPEHDISVSLGHGLDTRLLVDNEPSHAEDELQLSLGPQALSLDNVCLLMVLKQVIKDEDEGDGL